MAQAMAARFFDEQPPADEPAEPLFTPTRARTH